MRDETRRMKTLRQSINLVMRAGRECHERMVVPVKRMMRLVVMMYRGGRESATQSGVTKRIRMKRVVRAGRVVADVGVLCVLRKSVREMKGSRRMLHRFVSCWRVSTISSSDLWCGDDDDASEGARLCPLPSCFSPVREVEDSGE